MNRRAVVLGCGALWFVACVSEKRVQTPSLDVTVEVSGTCGQAGCRVDVLDDVALYNSSFQLWTPGPDGEADLYGCGAYDAPLPLASLEVRLKLSDGGTRVRPLVVGTAYPAFKPARQVGFGPFFDLNFDGGIEALEPEITVVEQGAGTITVRYAAPEKLYLVDGGEATLPGLQIIETFRYEHGSRAVDFVYEPICAPSRSPGFY